MSAFPRLPCALLANLLLVGAPALAHEHGEAAADSRINGSVPPGRISRSSGETQLSRGLDGKGNEMLVMRTTRAPGTRTPVHEHEHGGTTCVLEGEMTLFLQGSAPSRAVAGTCYYMPAGHHMVGANTGNVDAVMLDTFLVPIGQPVWTVVEASAKDLQNQFAEPAKP